MSPRRPQATPGRPAPDDKEAAVTENAQPRVDMSDAEIHLISVLTDVPADKVRGIVWLAEWRMREQGRRPSPPLWPGPIGYDPDPCIGCSPYCDSIACPKRTVVTYSGDSTSGPPPTTRNAK